MITHNLIQDVPRFGIEEQSYTSTIPSGDNTIEYNEILNSGQQTPDTGAIYLFAAQDPAALGDTIAYNEIINTGGLGTTATGFIAGQYLSSGIYLDNYVSNAQVYGNFVSGTTNGGVLLHGGNNNQIYNNVLVNNTEFGIELLEIAPTLMTGTTIHNNVVEEPTDTGSEIVSLNPAYVTPSLIYSNIYLSPTGFTPWIADNSFAGWQAAGGDKGSSIVTSAGFVNAAAGNYAFAPGSVALLDGIPQLPWSSFGPISSLLPDMLSLALSEDAYDGNAQFTVKVDGTVIGGPTQVTASHAVGATEIFTYSGDWGSGPQTVEVDYANQVSGGTASDNQSLYVDQIEYDGVSDLSSTVPLYVDGTFVLSAGTTEPDIGLSVPTNTASDNYGNAVAVPFVRLSDSLASDVVTLSLAASSGTIAMTSAAGAALPGSGTSAITVSGSQAELLSDLATLKYTGTATGSATVSVTATDAAGAAKQSSLGVTVSLDTISLSLSESAYRGNAQFIVKVDGTQVGGPTPVTASRAAGASQTFSYSGDWGLTPQTIEVDFANGLTGQTAATTRALYLNQVTYNGVAELSQVATLSSTAGYILSVHPTT